MSQTVKVNRLKLIQDVTRAINDLEKLFGDDLLRSQLEVDQAFKKLYAQSDDYSREAYKISNKGEYVSMEFCRVMAQTKYDTGKILTLKIAKRHYTILDHFLNVIKNTHQQNVYVWNSVNEILNSDIIQEHKEWLEQEHSRVEEETMKLKIFFDDIAADVVSRLKVKKHNQTTKQIPEYVPPPKDVTCTHNDCDTQQTHDTLMKYDTNNIVTWSGLIILACVLGYIVIQLGV